MSSIKRVIREKAKALVSLSHTIDLSELSVLNEEQKQIEALPTRGSQQRLTQAEQMWELGQRKLSMLSRWGSAVESTCNFVVAHQDKLTPELKRALQKRMVPR